MTVWSGASRACPGGGQREQARAGPDVQHLRAADHTSAAGTACIHGWMY